MLPLRDMYLFIGVPVLLGLSLSTYSKYRQNNNKSSLYITLASLFLCVSIFFSGVPSLFTWDSRLLSYFSFVAEVSQLAMLVILWLLVIKVYVPNKPKARIVGYIAIGVLSLLYVVESAIRNLTPPYPAGVVEISNIAYDIIFNESLAYMVMNGISYLSLLFLGVFFWRNASLSDNPAQKIRLKGLALALVLGGVLYAFVPDIPWGSNFNLKDIALCLVYLIMGVTMLVGAILKRRNNAVPPVVPAPIIDPPTEFPNTPIR